MVEEGGGGAEDRDLRNKGSNHGKACPSLEGRKRVQSSEGLAEHFHEGRCEPAQRTSIGAVVSGSERCNGHGGRRDRQGGVNVGNFVFHEGRDAGKKTTPGGRE